MGRNIYLRLLFLMMIVGVFIACQKGETTAKKETDLKAYAKAEVLIERLRKQTPPDWDAIEKAYVSQCAKLVAAMDKKHNTGYSEDIPVAIDNCKKGIDPKVNQQTLAKGLQHISVMKIRDLMDLMANAGKKERETIVADIADVFEGIRPTFTRRDKDYFNGEKTLEKEADLALQALKNATGSNYIAAANYLERAINKTYALCVLYEMQAIEKLRDTDLPACDVKLAEAVVFYRIIEPKIRKKDRSAHQVIQSILNADYTAVNAKQLEAALSRGLSIDLAT